MEQEGGAAHDMQSASERLRVGGPEMARHIARGTYAQSCQSRADPSPRTAGPGRARHHSRLTPHHAGPYHTKQEGIR